MSNFWFVVAFCITIAASFFTGHLVCSYHQPLYRLASKNWPGSDLNLGQTTKYFALAMYWCNDFKWSFPDDEFWVEQQAKRGTPWIKINMDYPDR